MRMFWLLSKGDKRKAIEFENLQRLKDGKLDFILEDNFE